MNYSAKTVFYFGIYLVFTGLIFLFIPEPIISLLQLPITPTGWSSVVGLLALVIGAYYIVCGKANNEVFINATLYVRWAFAIGATLLFVVGQMPVSIILFGGVDALGAVWTAMALKSAKGK
jgi:hypothetical protein